MPLRIDIVLPASEADRILPAVQEMVADGIVSVTDLHVVSHKTQKHLIPRHLRVRDVMTASPKSVRALDTRQRRAAAALVGGVQQRPCRG